jgi:hypothetical protein
MSAQSSCALFASRGPRPALITDAPQYRAKNDLTNPIAAGFVAGAILARTSGPKAMLFGGGAFAAFSGAIDMYFRREAADEP